METSKSYFIEYCVGKKAGHLFPNKHLEELNDDENIILERYIQKIIPTIGQPFAFFDWFYNKGITHYKAYFEKNLFDIYNEHNSSSANTLSSSPRNGVMKWTWEVYYFLHDPEDGDIEVNYSTLVTIESDLEALFLEQLNLMKKVFGDIKQNYPKVFLYNIYLNTISEGFANTVKIHLEESDSNSPYIKASNTLRNDVLFPTILRYCNNILKQGKLSQLSLKDISQNNSTYEFKNKKLEKVDFGFVGNKNKDLNKINAYFDKIILNKQINPFDDRYSYCDISGVLKGASNRQILATKSFLACYVLMKLKECRFFSKINSNTISNSGIFSIGKKKSLSLKMLQNWNAKNKRVSECDIIDKIYNEVFEKKNKK